MWRNRVSKKVIQVPVDIELLNELDRFSVKQSKARAELIRQACQRYLDELKSEEMDKIYRQGYEKIPEDSRIGGAQVGIISKITPAESW
jgi:metal-responsive CopG/Arc/MetJ family transcriptional regulator